MYRKAPVIAITLILFILPAAADWSITDLENPESIDDLSNGTQSVQLIYVEDNNDDPVNETRLDETSWDLNYNYSGSESNMEHLNQGYWYANFSANSSRINMTYELFNTDPSGEEINTTEQFNYENYTVDILTEFDKLKPNEQKFVEVNVTDEISNESENDNATVEFHITNGTNTKTVELGYNNGLFTNFITIPDYYNSDVAMHAHAFNSTMSGSQSTLTKIFPENTGNVTYLNASAGCNNESFFSQCERTAEIETGFNATVLPADSVTLEIMAPESSGGYHSFENISMEKENGIWHANYSIPDINTSKYDKKIVTHYNASIENEDFEITRNISYESFDIRDKSNPSAFPGTNYKIKILFGKYYSLEPLNGTRIDQANVTIEEPGGSVFEQFDFSDLIFNEENELYENEISIPEDAEEGNYQMDIEGWNIYDEKKTRSSAFTVESADSSFNTTDELNFNYSKIGFQSEEFEITNRLSRSLDISAKYSGEIENITTFNGGSDLSLADSETRNVSINFDLPEVKDYEGTMTLTGSENDYSKDIDVDIEGPNCVSPNGTLCYDGTQMSVNVTADQVRSYTRNVTIRNLGETSSFLSVDVTGDVSEYLTVTPNGVNVVDEQEFVMNYTPKREGTFTGTVSFSDLQNEINFNTEFVSNVENLQTGISTTSSINIASAVRGGSLSRQISITNTGDVNITGLSADSSTFSLSLSSLDEDITPGESRSVELTMNNLQVSSGEITVNGQTQDQGSASATISVSGSLDDYQSDIDDVRSRITTLRGQAESQDIRTRLSDAETTLSEIETLYDQGDVDEAETQLSQLRSELDTIESDIDSSSSPEQPPEQQPGGEDPGQTDGTDSESDGGSPIIIIAVIIFVLLIAGFIFYTSYIPEEGDPLYDYLGDR